MPNLNKVMLMGNLTRDPELRRTPKGSAVTDISLATNRRYTDSNDQQQEETTYVDVTLWGKVAEIVSEHTKKGDPIYIEGRLLLDQWEDKNTGQNRSRLKVIGEKFEFLAPKPKGGTTSQEPPHHSTQRDYPPSQGQGQPYPDSNSDSDLF